MVYAPNPDVFGNDAIDYYVTGGINTSKAARISIKILPVNDQPSFKLATNLVVVGEDDGTIILPNFAYDIVKGTANESKQAVKFIVNVPDEQTLLFAGVKRTVNKPNPDGAYIGYGLPQINAKGLLKSTPAKNSYGDVTVTVQMMDSGGTTNGGINLSEGTTFILRITNVNDAPVIGRIASATINKNGSTNFVVNVSDTDNAPESLTLSVASSNKDLLPDQNITVSKGESPTQRVVQVIPVADNNGTTLLTFTVSDGNGGTASVSALLRVISVNDSQSFVLERMRTSLQK